MRQEIQVNFPSVRFDMLLKYVKIIQNLTLNSLHKVSQIRKKKYDLYTTNNPGANTVHVSVTCTILIQHLHSKEVLGIYAMQQPDVQLVRLDQY